MIKTGQLLDRLGYDYYVFETPEQKPQYSSKTFADYLPQLADSSIPRCRMLAQCTLYKHQEEGFQVLNRGENLVLKSGTGSGKTESWFLHMVVNNRRTLAIYPTLALANDQITRLEEYCRALGRKALALDAMKKAEMAKDTGMRGLRREIDSSDLVVTNPALLLNDVKRIWGGEDIHSKRVHITGWLTGGGRV
ncbi:MAG: DEAD/DEAH box helicase [Nitrososphaerota archaeon]